MIRERFAAGGAVAAAFASSRCVVSRFLYVNSGTLAGQSDSCWTRRAKVPFRGVTWAMVEEVIAGAGKVLEARIAGTAGDGGPACATVPLLDGGWRVVHTLRTPPSILHNREVKSATKFPLDPIPRNTV